MGSWDSTFLSVSAIPSNAVFWITSNFTFTPILFMYSLKLKRVGVNVIQQTALLGTAKILRKVLSLYVPVFFCCTLVDVYKTGGATIQFVVFLNSRFRSQKDY